MNRGREVEKLQQALLELGSDLPRYGVDGWLGSETLNALARLLQAHGRSFDDNLDVVCDEELAFVYDLQEQAKRAEAARIPPERFFDVRAQAGPSTTTASGRGAR